MTIDESLCARITVLGLGQSVSAAATVVAAIRTVEMQIFI
jgi:hypothetical protein